jgi:hypothetical protein
MDCIMRAIRSSLSLHLGYEFNCLSKCFQAFVDSHDAIPFRA